MPKKKDWKNDYKLAEKAQSAVMDLLPALEKRDETNKRANFKEYEDIKAKDMTTRIYEELKAIFNRGWGNG